MSTRAHLKRLALLLPFLLAVPAAVHGQSPPPHPRLLFTAAQIPGIQARVNASGSPAAGAYALCATSVSVVTGTSQSAFTVMRSLRRMTEVAFRYQMTGNAGYGATAKSMLLSVIPTLTPTGSTPYQLATYPCALAITYDLVHPLLTASERTTVVNHLVAWVNALRTGSNGYTPYTAYSAAADNFSFAWCTGIVMPLLAIWGETTYPNLLADVQSNLAMIRSGWTDPISPDGSVDESYGYASYGNLYSILAGIAAQNCGLGDQIAGTNLLKTPRWIAASLMGSDFIYTGDSSPAHKGERLDPILYHLVDRAADPVGLWGLERVFAVEPVSDSTPSQAFSPYLNKALFYPAGLAPQPPAVASAFFRDNLNAGTPSSNQTTNHPEVGLGGEALLHNDASPSAAQLSGLFLIRDEWMNHGHEDDGHFSLVSEGAHFYLDLGYANTNTYAFAQSQDHNIVLAAGVAGFNGDANNYYNPPAPNGRFLGRREASLLAPGIDYVRGDHANMWMMQEAHRTVVLVKDPQSPYFILVDRVRKNAAVQTYEEVFHAAGPATGAGTASNPLVVTAAGRSLRATWLAPAAPVIVPGTPATASSGLAYHRHRVTTTGAEATFISVHGRNGVTAVQPLAAPFANTAGGTAVWPAAADKILVRTGAGTMGDLQTRSDARFVWIRAVDGQLAGWSLAEGTALIHAGETLLVASAPVVVASRGNRIDVTRVVPASTPLGLILRAAGPVTTVTVDGASVPFLVSGERILVGPPPLPASSADDRLYAFETGNPGDGILEGPAFVAGGRLRSAGGSGGIRLKGGLPVPARPFSFSADVLFEAGASGNAGGLIIESIPGAADVLRVEVAPFGQTALLLTLVPNGPQNAASVSIPNHVFGGGGRVTALFRPAAGQADILDGMGIVRATVPVILPSSGVRLRAVTNEQASLDNVTLFDSEEDGATAQGVVFTGLPDGRVVYALHAPQILLFQDSGLHVGGQRVSHETALMWMIGAWIQEVAATPSIPPGSVIPLTLREVVFQSLFPASLTQPGFNLGVSLTTPLGQELYGGFTY